MTVRIMNLVAPLPHKVTDMHTADTAAQVAGRSGAVSLLNTRQGDVESANKRPSIRTSTTAIRTTTTCLPSVECVPSAASSNYSFDLLLRAYLDCRKHKRNSGSALAFEQDLERNLWNLHLELSDGSYAPGRSICFVITRPKPREVWAADFRDRIVHHLLHNQISPRFYAAFIVDSCACIPGRGTLYAAQRLEAKVRSITQNWSKPAFYLKMDLANFFVAIDKPWRRITRRRTFTDAIRRVSTIGADDLFETANSYYGLLRQSSSSHHDRALLSNALRKRGHSIKSDLTKTYRRAT